MNGSRSELTREEAAAALDRAEVTVLPFEADEWPIAAAMLQFPTALSDGRNVRSAGPEAWAKVFFEIAAYGFSLVELPSSWLPLGEMTPSEAANLVAVMRDAGVHVAATSVVRRNIIDRVAGKENLHATHRAIDAAAAIGAPHVSLGLHESLTSDQLAATWFWTVPGAENPQDPDVWNLAVRRGRELGDHAADVGVEISFETYEGTYLGSADGAVRFIEAIDRANVGLNPDIGNLIRAQQPIEPWELMVVKTLPYANYWHVKNYARAENPIANQYMTTPSSLASGLINYRKAIRFAIANGFRGAFLCENYGGDGLAVIADHRRYLRDVLRTTAPPTQVMPQAGLARAARAR